MQAMVDRIVTEWGRLEVAVNNAGIEISRPFLEATDEEWERVIRVNLYGPYLVSQCAARAMVAKGDGGRLLNSSSVHEDFPFPGYTSYCASKGGRRWISPVPEGWMRWTDSTLLHWLLNARLDLRGP